MTAAVDQVQITTPGVYDLPDHIYHADPVPGRSLSSTGARKLLPPNCPAKFAYWREHPEQKPEFDYGKAAHLYVLGAGPPIDVVDAADWRTKAAREQMVASYAAGRVPLLTADHDRVVAMADAVRQHPIAGRMFNPEHGQPEQSLFWVDRSTGVWCRARLDWLPAARTSGRLILADYKTCNRADLDSVQRAIATYGYHQQAAFYLAGARALGLAEDFAFVFVMQEKDPPYLVSVVEPDAAALRIGRLLNRGALELYAECARTGRWPGYSDEVVRLPLPPYIENRYLKEIW
jgi:hypothetical protein